MQESSASSLAGPLLRKLREQLGYTREQATDKTEISVSTLKRLESGTAEWGIKWWSKIRELDIAENPPALETMGKLGSLLDESYNPNPRLSAEQELQVEKTIEDLRFQVYGVSEDDLSDRFVRFLRPYLMPMAHHGRQKLMGLARNALVEEALGKAPDSLAGRTTKVTPRSNEFEIYCLKNRVRRPAYKALLQFLCDERGATQASEVHRTIFITLVWPKSAWAAEPELSGGSLSHWMTKQNRKFSEALKSNVSLRELAGWLDHQKWIERKWGGSVGEGDFDKAMSTVTSLGSTLETRIRSFFGGLEHG